MSNIAFHARQLKTANGALKFYNHWTFLGCPEVFLLAVGGCEHLSDRRAWISLWQGNVVEGGIGKLILSTSSTFSKHYFHLGDHQQGQHLFHSLYNKNNHKNKKSGFLEKKQKKVTNSKKVTQETKRTSVEVQLIRKDFMHCIFPRTGN
jgi:hypothetical protein